MYFVLSFHGDKKMTMVNCIRFKPIQGCEEDVFRETSRIYETLDGALEKRLVALDDGEYASVIVWKSVDHFVEVLNRDIRLIDVLKPYVVAYDDGEYFQAISGPTVDLSGYT